MKRVFLVSKLMVVCFLILRGHGFASDQKLPVIDGKETVATVNDEPITLEELNQAIAASHTARKGKKKAGHIDFSTIMERMINSRLLLLEARNMGVHELPELTEVVEKYSKQTMIELLFEQSVKDIKVDEDEVYRLYKEYVREWIIKSIKFQKEADAKKIEAQIKAENDFDAIAQKEVSGGFAEGGKTEYYKDKDFTPAVTRLVHKMEINAISPVVSFGKKSFVIFKLEGTRYPEDEDPQAREWARREALNRKKVRTTKKYYNDLKNKNIKMDEKLLESLDYESKEPGIENLLKDERILVEITDEKPLTVGELSRALEKKFYHGLERAIKGKRINKKKREILEDMIQRRILLKEALAQGIDQTEIYKNRVKKYEDSLIFGAFIKKVVAPEIKLNQNELKTYYQENSQEYTSPGMMRIKSLIFAKRSEAVASLDKLMKGTDFDWLSSHADGQVDKTNEGLLKFEGMLLILSSMPEGVQEVVSGANPGDFRLYASPEGHFYVLYIYHVVDPKLRPFENVKAEIAEHVYKHKLEKAVDDWADKLKEYYPVVIYRKDLRK